jgi:hypothetical protein
MVSQCADLWLTHWHWGRLLSLYSARHHYFVLTTQHTIISLAFNLEASFLNQNLAAWRVRKCVLILPSEASSSDADNYTIILFLDVMPRSLVEMCWIHFQGRAFPPLHDVTSYETIIFGKKKGSHIPLFALSEKTNEVSKQFVVTWGNKFWCFHYDYCSGLGLFVVTPCSSVDALCKSTCSRNMLRLSSTLKCECLTLKTEPSYSYELSV